MMSKALLERWSLWVTLALALLGGVLGAIGWYLYLTTCESISYADFPLELFYRTLLLFFGEHSLINDIDVECRGTALRLAAVLAPLATLSALLRLITGQFLAWYHPFRISRRKGNTVICGMGDYGHAFARNIASESENPKLARRIVAVEKDPSPEIEHFCRRLGIDLVCGDTRSPEVLESAGIIAADRMIVVTGDDNTNIETAMAAQHCVQKRSPHEERLKANVSLHDPGLWRQVMASRGINRIFQGFTFKPVNLAIVAARKFLWEMPLSRYAELRLQTQAHAVFVGFDGYAEAVIVEFLKTAQYKTQDKPLITVLAADAGSVRNVLLRHYPEIEQVCQRLTVIDFDPKADPLDAPHMHRVEAVAPVTAVFVCQPSDHLTLGLGIYIQDAMQRLAFWGAPLFLRMGQCQGARRMLCPRRNGRRFDDVIEAFGTESELCDMSLIDSRIDGIARKLHESYREKRRQQEDYNSAKTESDCPWDELPETYRDATRRAADHLKVKLRSRGCAPFEGDSFIAPESLKQFLDGDWNNRLAKLEHESWEASRRLDGWRGGKQRDNRRKLHPNLLQSYDALSDNDREYDREQIRKLAAEFIAYRPSGDPDITLRLECVIGLVGVNRLTLEEARELTAFMIGNLMAYCCETMPDVYLTFITPLAPGSDYIMARTALDYCENEGIPHRLLIVEGVPECNMIDDYRAAYDAGAAWDGAPRPTGENWDKTLQGLGARQQILEARQALIERDAVDWIIDLTRRDCDYETSEDRQAGYEDAGRYIADRAHILAAACRKDARPLKGGTRALLDYRADAQPASDWPDTFPHRTLVHEMAPAG